MAHISAPPPYITIFPSLAPPPYTTSSLTPPVFFHQLLTPQIQFILPPMIPVTHPLTTGQVPNWVPRTLKWELLRGLLVPIEIFAPSISNERGYNTLYGFDEGPLPPGSSGSGKGGWNCLFGDDEGPLPPDLSGESEAGMAVAAQTVREAEEAQLDVKVGGTESEGSDAEIRGGAGGNIAVV